MRITTGLALTSDVIVGVLHEVTEYSEREEEERMQDTALDVSMQAGQRGAPVRGLRTATKCTLRKPSKRREVVLYT